ncbi:hypothetical protein D9Q98_004747 [Chlorella vulgaris]|jgi:hypothetical protein|uniref:Uncharacterized protein n=1 Tax=Chlorella vulgaris TaxID=3077 RepID=A0A9D4YXL0_CHLVU|nr:hypothetical protein D9Q98_004747 [Chlorella vulgaris]
MSRIAPACCATHLAAAAEVAGVEFGAAVLAAVAARAGASRPYHTQLSHGHSHSHSHSHTYKQPLSNLALHWR